MFKAIGILVVAVVIVLGLIWLWDNLTINRKQNED